MTNRSISGMHTRRPVPAPSSFSVRSVSSGVNALCSLNFGLSTLNLEPLYSPKSNDSRIYAHPRVGGGMITTKQTNQRMPARRHFAQIPFVWQGSRSGAELWMGKRRCKPAIRSFFAKAFGNATPACTLKWLAIHHDNWLSRQALLLCGSRTALRPLPALGSLPRDLPLQPRSSLFAQHPLIEEVDQEIQSKNAKRDEDVQRHLNLSKTRHSSRLISRRPKSKRRCDGKSLEVHQKFVKNQEA
jgi:hypothetical protein